MTTLNTLRVKRQNAIIIRKRKHVPHFKMGCYRSGNSCSHFLTSQWKCLASSWQKMGGHGEQFHLMSCGNRDSSLPMLCLHDAGVLGARAPRCLDHSIQLNYSLGPCCWDMVLQVLGTCRPLPFLLGGFMA